MTENNEIRENNIQQEDLNEILRVRREKLLELQRTGKDPFEQVKYEVTANHFVPFFRHDNSKRTGTASKLQYQIGLTSVFVEKPCHIIRPFFIIHVFIKPIINSCNSGIHNAYFLPRLMLFIL
jgi:hypothetical protein